MHTDRALAPSRARHLTGLRHVREAAARSIRGRRDEVAAVRRIARFGDVIASQLEPMRDGRRLLVREHQLWQLRSEGSTSLDREQNVGDSARQMSEHVPPRAQTVGPWVATLRGDVVFSADTAREVVAWLEAQDLIADSLYRLPVDPSAAEGAAPA